MNLGHAGALALSRRRVCPLSELGAPRQARCPLDQRSRRHVRSIKGAGIEGARLVKTTMTQHESGFCRARDGGVIKKNTRVKCIPIARDA